MRSPDEKCTHRQRIPESSKNEKEKKNIQNYHATIRFSHAHRCAHETRPR